MLIFKCGLYVYDGADGARAPPNVNSHPDGRYSIIIQNILNGILTKEQHTLIEQSHILIYYMPSKL